ncbi:MAG: hypothetical protein ACI8X5_001005 [Planctomycetota bacterium]
MESLGARMRFGTSSWSAKSWLGNFYPQGTKPRDFLAAYAHVFKTVEADVTYYRVPSRSMVQGWRDRTPKDFVMAAKFPRGIVHAGQGPSPDASRVLVYDYAQKESEAFLTAMGELGSKCGPLVLQFPYFNSEAFKDAGPFMERLDTFLGSLPLEFRYAVEIRNKNWVSEEFLEMLRSHRVAFTLLDLAYMPHGDELSQEFNLVTTDFLYLRLIGDRKKIDALTETFDKLVIDQERSLRRWAKLINKLADEVSEIFGYANNHYAGHGPATAAQLQSLVRGEEPGAIPHTPRSGELPFS